MEDLNFPSFTIAVRSWVPKEYPLTSSLPPFVPGDFVQRSLTGGMILFLRGRIVRGWLAKERIPEPPMLPRWSFLVTNGCGLPFPSTLLDLVLLLLQHPDDTHLATLTWAILLPGESNRWNADFLVFHLPAFLVHFLNRGFGTADLANPVRTRRTRSDSVACTGAPLARAEVGPTKTGNTHQQERGQWLHPSTPVKHDERWEDRAQGTFILAAGRHLLRSCTVRT